LELARSKRSPFEATKRLLSKAARARFHPPAKAGWRRQPLMFPIGRAMNDWNCLIRASPPLAGMKLCRSMLLESSLGACNDCVYCGGQSNAKGGP